jgi:hypothetical protein
VPVGAHFDFVMAAEDIAYGARIANYSIEYQLANSSDWHVLVPPVWKKLPAPAGMGDRPDGHDPRDSHIGRKRIDTPIVSAVGVARVRLNCIEAFQTPVHVRNFSLHQKVVPWEARANGRVQTAKTTTSKAEARST